MLVDLDSAGPENTVAGATTITAEHFGARYISLRDEDRFFDQVADFDGGLLVWPGGSLAERLVDRYGFEHHGLYNSAGYGDKPGRGLLEDEAYLAIFRDMIQETKANLQSILEIYAANSDEGWKSACKEAGNLSYAASHMELEDWSTVLQSLITDAPPTKSRAPL